jgi:hypothetical protein
MNSSNLATGAKSLIEWFGDSLLPVSHGEAERRAQICSKCVNNQHVGWFERWGEHAGVVMGINWWLKRRGCDTVYDHKLHVCSACDCPMKVKVWCPDNIIKNHMSNEAKSKLTPECWLK